MAGELDRSKLRGVVPVLEVPFHPDERLDVDGFVDVVEHVLGTGASGVMFPGFASEFHKLDAGERDALLEVLIPRCRAAGVAAVVAVQDHGTRVATRSAVAAAKAGAHAINLLPPHQLGPNADAVEAHIAAILLSVDPVPVILQHAPGQTGNGLDPSSISRLARAHPNLSAVKVESTPPGRMIAALAAATPAVPAFVGYAGVQLLDALRRGAIGVQPGCSFAELYVRVWRTWERGDVADAEALHGRMLPYLAHWMQSVELIIAAEKLISFRRGLIAAPTCRAPAHVLDDFEVAQVERFLVDFADYLDPVGRS